MDKVIQNEKLLKKELTKLSIEIFYKLKFLIINLDSIQEYDEAINESIMILHEFIATLVKIANKLN